MHANGRCPIHRSVYADLLDHLRKAHPEVHFTEHLLAGTHLAACPCGAVVKAQSHLALHRSRARCSEWKRLQSACTPPRRSSTRTRAATTRPTEEQVQVIIPTTQPSSPLASPSPPPPDHWPSPPVDVPRLLASLPTSRKPFHSAYAAHLFADTADRLAAMCLANFNAQTLLHFLCFPKVAWVPALGSGKQQRQKLENYPRNFNQLTLDLSARNTEALETRAAPSSHATPHASNPERVQQQIEKGLISRAANLLSSNQTAQPPMDDTLRFLQQKHPPGPAHPFGNNSGYPLGTTPDASLVASTLTSFKPDTSPGVTGWTYPMLRTCLEKESVHLLIASLAKQIAQGTCPCRDLLCSSRLIAINKDDGEVRPIAIGDLIYRLCSKMILKHYSNPDHLLKWQLGVGTPGGVAVVTRAIERGLAGDLGGNLEPRQLALLDFKNAFNSVDRKQLATGLQKYAPQLFKAAKWAYNDQSPLFLSDSRRTEQLWSSQGVRQGDPFGPLFFSIAIRDTLHQLEHSLGPGNLVLAYLDDVCILSEDPDVLDKVIEFFNDKSSGSPIRLNVSKCKSMSFDQVARDGLDLLGSHVGNETTRKQFLLRKISEQVVPLRSLQELPKQHAFLLLRLAIQQNLRHLLRTLDHTGLEGTWNQLDEQLYQATAKIRGGTTELRDLDRQLFSLPLKMGGLGILSHAESANDAKIAAKEQADNALSSILDIDHETNTNGPSQKELVSPKLAHRRLHLLQSLSVRERVSVMESSSPMGRKWLSLIPYNKSLAISGENFSAGLHIRTLIPPSRHLCERCGLQNSVTHHSRCFGRGNGRLARHEVVKQTIMDTIRSIPNTYLEKEPIVPGTQERTDFRVVGQGALSGGSEEFDITIVSTESRKAQLAIQNEEARNPMEEANRGPEAQALRHLEITTREASERKKAKYQSRCASTFRPLVITSGGYVPKHTWSIFDGWKNLLGTSTYSRFQQRLSILLFRARVRYYTF